MMTFAVEHRKFSVTILIDPTPFPCIQGSYCDGQQRFANADGAIICSNQSTTAFS